MPTLVITGATKGIGRATAIVFAEIGFDIAFCARTAADVEAFEQELKVRFPQQQFLGVAADVSTKAGCRSFAAVLGEQFKEVGILVNNAGVFLPCSLSGDKSDDNFVTMLNANLMSAYFLTREILPLLRGQAKAHIFNLCSIASFMPYSGYSVSKFALLGFSKVLREELAEADIRVTAVMPGATLTPAWSGTSHPPSRFMLAEDIAQAILSAYQLSAQTVVEEIILRPQLGDV